MPLRTHPVFVLLSSDIGIGGLPMKRLFSLFLLLSFPLAAAGPEVVATFEGKKISEAEVIAPVAAQLR